MLPPLASRMLYIFGQRPTNSATALILELAYHLFVFCAVAWMVLRVVTEVIFLGTFVHVCIDIFGLDLKQ